MRVQLTTSPQRLTELRGPAWLTCRAISGSVRLAGAEQELLAGQGLPIETADRIVSFRVPPGAVWLQSSGGAAELEVFVS